MKKSTLFPGLLILILTIIPEHILATGKTSSLPIDSVCLSPGYYTDHTYLLNYMDITVFFGKDIDSIDGKFYMAPEGITIASTPMYAHYPESNFQYHIAKSSYLYYCDEVEIRNQHELFIPYRNYFSAYNHHLKYDCKYQLLFVGEIHFSDGSEYVNTESDVLAEFITAPIPDNIIKAKGTFTPEDIAHIGFSKDHLEDPVSDRYISATYGKTAIHNLPPVTADDLTGNDINVAIVDLQIYWNTLVNKAVVFRSHPLEDEMFIEKEKIALLSQDPDSIMPLYNHGTQMARYMLNYAPEINIYNYNKLATMDNVFPDSLFAASIMDPAHKIDIASFSGSSPAIEALAEGVHNGLIISRSLGNDITVTNTFDDTKNQDLFLPHYSPFLTGNNLETMTGAFVTLQGALFDRKRPGLAGEYDINTAFSLRSGAGDAREYTLSVFENGNGATSEATATFSGMVALMLEANKKYQSNYTPREVVEILFQTAIDVGKPGVDSTFGWGVPDMGAALEHIKTQAPVIFDLYGVNEVNTHIPVSGEAEDFDVKIFPNPSTQYITIQLNSIEKGLSYIKLFDMSGKVFLSQKIQASDRTIELDLKLLPSDIYIVHFYSKKGVAVSRKIIKK